MQAKVVFGDAVDHMSFSENCKQKELKCPVDVVLEENPKPKDASCKLSASGYPKDSSILTSLEQQAFPSGMPANMVKVLNFVGALWSVPPSVILANMLEEGAFEHAPTWQWTDETVKTYSDCTIAIPMGTQACSSFISGTGAKGPIGIFQTQIDGVDLTSTDEYKNPYARLLSDPLFKDVLEKRPKDTFSACNFFDAAIFAAWDISMNQSHIYGIPVPLSCRAGVPAKDYALSQDTLRAASCADWTADRAALARWQYDDRLCDNGIARTVSTFEKY